MAGQEEDEHTGCGGRCGLEEDDPARDQLDVTESLLESRQISRSMFSWEGAAAKIRGICGSQKYEPLDKVKRLRDFASVLSEFYKPAPDESCWARFKGGLGYCWTASTGIELSMKQNFPHESGCLDWNSDVVVPNSWCCLVFAGALTLLGCLSLLADDGQIVGLVFGIILLTFLCCCCWCGHFCWSCESKKVCLDATGIFSNLFAIYSIPSCGAWLCLKYKNYCGSCQESHLEGAPHAHTGEIHALRVHKYLEVLPVPCSICMANFNYMYFLVDLPTGNVAGVDLAEPEVALEALEWLKRQHTRKGLPALKLTTVLTTHKHHDHAEGNFFFQEEYPDVVIVGGKGEGVPCATVEMEVRNL